MAYPRRREWRRSVSWRRRKASSWTLSTPAKPWPPAWAGYARAAATRTRRSCSGTPAASPVFLPLIKKEKKMNRGHRWLPAAGLTAVFLSGLVLAAGAPPPPKPDLGIDADLHGRRPFPPDNPWNQPIDKEPVDPNSDTLISSIGRNKPLHP